MNNYLIGAGVLVAFGVGIKLLSNSNEVEDFPLEQLKEAIQNLKSQTVRIPPGIINQGNTCYINSVLQLLASSPTMKQFFIDLGEYMIKESFNTDKLRLSQNIVFSLIQVLADLNDPANDCIDAGQLICYLEQEAQYFAFKEQQDSHELLNMLLSHLDLLIDISKEESLKTLVNDQIKLYNPLRGQVCTYLHCPKCDYKYNMNIESSLGLSLDIRSFSVTSVREALQAYFTEEKVNGYTCTKCSLIKLSERIPKHMDEYAQVQILMKQSTLDFEEAHRRCDQMSLALSQVKNQVTKVTELQRLPAVQIIHLKRLTVDMYGDPIKLQKHIQFDEELTVKSKTNQKTYRLSAVIAHQGGESFGHYITCRKVLGKWYVISDNIVKESSLQQISGAQAYMLIYD